MVETPFHVLPLPAGAGWAALTMTRFARPLEFDRNGEARNARPDDFAVPHVWTFSALYRGAQKTYEHLFDEAMEEGRDQALAMKRDVHLAALLQERKLAVAGLKWHLEVDDDRDPKLLRLRDGLTPLLEATPHLQKISCACWPPTAEPLRRRGRPGRPAPPLLTASHGRGYFTASSRTRPGSMLLNPLLSVCREYSQM
jgi:hypothetical protein